ncbi:MAG: gluconokinase [Spirochaetes bacterium]|nr:gluconokinase [Spirochaetota bacterium]
MIIIIMGVSGCGKSLIGSRLAKELEIPFFDADDFHPQHNVDKMSQGIPLVDEDRFPWLELLAKLLADWEKQGGAVLACSALKEQYRQLLKRETASKPIFIYLKGSMEVISQRMKARVKHYMPVSLLKSQFDALEEPRYGISVNIEQSPEMIIRYIKKSLTSIS